MKTEKQRRTTILTLRVSPPEERALRLAARAEQITVSELIRRAVRDRADQLAAPKMAERNT